MKHLALAALPDGSLLTADLRGLVLWGADGRKRAEFRRPSLAEMVLSLAVDPNGRFFMLADDNTNLELWEVRRSLGPSHRKDVVKNIHSIRVDSSGTSAATVDGPGGITKWEIQGT